MPKKPTQQVPDFSKWKVAPPDLKQTKKFFLAPYVTPVVSVFVLLAVVVVAFNTWGEKPEVVATVMPTLQVQIPPLQPVSEAPVIQHISTELPETLPDLPGFSGVPAFSELTVSSKDWLTGLDGGILVELQTPITGLSPQQIGSEAYDNSQRFIFALTQLGDVNQEQSRESVVASRRAALDEMEAIAAWFKNSSSDPLVESFRRNLWESYRNVAMDNVNLDNIWWLTNYLNSMKMLANTPEEVQETETLVENVSAELERQREERAVALVPTAMPTTEVVSQPEQQPEVNPTAETVPAPTVVAVAAPEEAPMVRPEAQPQPEGIRVYNPEEPVTALSDPFVFETLPMQNSLSGQLPVIPLDTGGFGLGWSLESTIRLTQQIWSLLTTGNTGPSETWVVFNVNEFPVTGKFVIYGLVFVRLDTLEASLPMMHPACASYIQARMEGRIISEGDSINGRIECSNYLFYSLKFPDGLFSGPHYGADGRIDHISTIWLNASRPPFEEGQTIEVKSLLEMFRR